MKPIIFDNMVDKTREPMGESIQVEFSDKHHVVDVESPLGLFPNKSLAEISEAARLAGQDFLAMFGRE